MNLFDLLGFDFGRATARYVNRSLAVNMVQEFLDLNHCVLIGKWDVSYNFLRLLFLSLLVLLLFLRFIGHFSGFLACLSHLFPSFLCELLLFLGEFFASCFLLLC